MISTIPSYGRPVVPELDVTAVDLHPVDRRDLNALVDELIGLRRGSPERFVETLGRFRALAGRLGVDPATMLNMERQAFRRPLD